MHFAFIPYGIKRCVDLLLNDMSAQKHRLIVSKGKEKEYVWMQGQVRILPFGIIEYVFPKEDLNRVLTRLNAGNPINHNISKSIISLLRKTLKLKKVPKKFKEDSYFLWIRDHVSIIPIGIKEDGDLVEPIGQYKGWTHEAI